MHKKGSGILFVPTNGAGLGHLTRTLAIARRIKKQNPSEEIIIFTTSPATHLIRQEGMIGYHYPSIELLKDQVKPLVWNKQLKLQLLCVINKHKPRIVVFDGAYPYEGVLSALKRAKKTVKVWVRKHIDQHSPQYKNIISKEKLFNHVVIPGEIGIIKKSTTKMRYSDPIIYLDRKELLSKEQVRKKFGIPDENKVIYIQLGAGKINDIQTPITKLITFLSNHYKNISIIIGESPIGDSMNIKGPNVQVIKEFPNSKYFNGFDFAVSAAGYNSVYESLYFNIPTLFIPNSNTKSDNQMIRASYAEKQGAALCCSKFDEAQLKARVESLLTRKDDFIKNSKRIVPNNGAEDVASIIYNLKEM